MITRNITPTKAILICLNSMIGAGLFISVRPLTEIAGALGFVSYIIAALILLPLILCIAELASLHPVAGGLYVYSNTYLGPWYGFLSGWGYFVGKTVSATVLMHKFVEFFYIRIPAMQYAPQLLIDAAMLFFIVGINSMGVSIGGRVQYVFTTLKAIPILFSIGASFYLFNPNNFKDIHDVTNILQTIPIALFPLLGFEVICAITNMIEDARNTIKRIILSAFSIVAIINICFLVASFGILGQQFKSINEPVLAIGLRALGSYPLIAQLINGAVFASIIGACFSLLTSNCWNLHTIARHGQLPGTSFLTKVNRFNVPWVSFLVEVIIGCLILLITVEQIPLQNMAVFAQVIAYLLSSLAAWYAVRTGATKRIAWWLPLLALAGCCVVLGICLHRIIALGISLPFLLILVAGVVLAVGKKFFRVS
ncbi:MAG: APC family permease [Candidatus Babeliales bacterium]